MTKLLMYRCASLSECTTAAARHSMPRVDNLQMLKLRRGRKRKLLPGKRADKATAEALHGTLNSDALPLRTLATPMATRKGRAQRY